MAIVDTGSLYYTVTDRPFFTLLQTCNVQLELIAGYAVAPLAMGTALIKIGDIELLLEDVLLATGSLNLLSVSALVRHGPAGNFYVNSSRILWSDGMSILMTYGEGHTLPIVPVRPMSTGVAPWFPSEYQLSASIEARLTRLDGGTYAIGTQPLAIAELGR